MDLLLLMMGIFILLGVIVGWGFTYIYGILMKKRWAYDVTIFEKRDNGYWVIQDKARKYVDQAGRPFFRLKKENKNIKPIKYEDILLSGKRGYFQVFSPNRDEFFATQFKDMPLDEKERKILEKKLQELGIPVEFATSFHKGMLEIIPDDMKFWYVNERKSAMDRWNKPPGFFEKYAGYMIVIAAGMMIAIMLMLVTKEMSGVANALGSTSTQLTELIKVLTEKGIEVKATGTPVIIGQTGGLPAPPV